MNRFSTALSIELCLLLLFFCCCWVLFDLSFLFCFIFRLFIYFSLFFFFIYLFLFYFFFCNLQLIDRMEMAKSQFLLNVADRTVQIVQTSELKQR